MARETQEPIEGVTRALRDYFNDHSIIPVSDPWSRICDGFLVRIHVYRWPGVVRLSPEDLGLTPTDYEKINKSMHWGNFNLIANELHRNLESLGVRARRLPEKWGWTVHWGQFVPMQAIPKLEADLASIQAEWAELIEEWVANYGDYYEQAEEKALALAEQANTNARLLNHGRKQINIEATVARLMRGYPDAETIRRRFRITSERAFIPMPTLEAEQAAHIALVEQQKLDAMERMHQEQVAIQEQCERDAAIAQAEDDLTRLRLLAQISAEEAKQRDKIRLINEHREQLQRDLETRREELLNEFYQGYAVEIRQRLHYSLMFVIEGIKEGKLSAGAGRSLRTVLEEISVLALDDDAEIQAMRERLAEVSGGSGSPAQVKQDIEDMGALLQTSILVLGQTPRKPDRMAELPLDVLAQLPDDAPDALLTDVRRRRERLGLESLAEQLVTETEEAPLRERAVRL